jgi:hypothetical protein
MFYNKFSQSSLIYPVTPHPMRTTMLRNGAIRKKPITCHAERILILLTLLRANVNISVHTTIIRSAIMLNQFKLLINKELQRKIYGFASPKSLHSMK